MLAPPSFSELDGKPLLSKQHATVRPSDLLVKSSSSSSSYHPTTATTPYAKLSNNNHKKYQRKPGVNLFSSSPSTPPAAGTLPILSFPSSPPFSYSNAAKHNLNSQTNSTSFKAKFPPTILLTGSALAPLGSPTKVFDSIYADSKKASNTLTASAAEFIPSPSTKPLLRFNYRNNVLSAQNNIPPEKIPSNFDHLRFSLDRVNRLANGNSDDEDGKSVDSDQSSAAGRSSVTTNSLADSLLTQSSYEEKLDDYFSDRGVGSGGAEPASLERRLEQRQKQVDYGKNTVGYARYIEMVPRHKRRRGDPETPDKHSKCSKRSWDGLVRSWRRKLHQWDPIEDETAGVVEGNRRRMDEEYPEEEEMEDDHCQPTQDLEDKLSQSLRTMRIAVPLEGSSSGSSAHSSLRGTNNPSPVVGPGLEGGGGQPIIRPIATHSSKSLSK